MANDDKESFASLFAKKNYCFNYVIIFQFHLKTITQKYHTNYKNCAPTNRRATLLEQMNVHLNTFMFFLVA